MSKGTKAFKQTIQEFITNKANNDSIFAERVNKEDKNIDDCVTYILNTVKKSGFNGFTDDEIFGMALHYYDEDDIDIGGDIKMQVVVNHQVQLTSEEIAEAKAKASKQVIDDEIARIRGKKKKKKQEPEKSENIQGTLF